MEKLQLLEQEKTKIRKDYERREGQVEVKKKMQVAPLRPWRSLPPGSAGACRGGLGTTLLPLLASMAGGAGRAGEGRGARPKPRSGPPPANACRPCNTCPWPPPPPPQ